MNTPSELFDFYGAYRSIYEAADRTKPKPTVLPRSRETNIGDQTVKGWNDPAGPERDWDREPTKRPTNREAQKKRLKHVIGTQRRQDIESGLRKEDIEYDSDYLLGEANRGDEHVTSNMYGDHAEHIKSAKIRRRQGRDLKGVLHPDEWSEGESHRQQRHEERRGVKKGLNASVEYVLDYLIGEGFTDSYEGAETILETMSDEWLETIIEGFVPLDDRKRALVTKFINKGIDKLKGNVSKIELAQKELANNQKPTHRIGSLVKDTKTTSRLVGNAQNARERTTQHRIDVTKKKLDLVTPKNSISKFQRDDVEYVLDYLIDEGYTDSYESAIAIVESMSDEWLEGIIDERTRYAKETGKSFTSGRRSEKGGLMKPTGDVHADVGRTAMLHVIKNLPPDTVRAGASGKAIPGGGVGSRQTKKVRGEKVPTTPRGYMTTKIKNYMRKVANYNIGSPFD